jgi:hypothetical protein
MAAESWRNGGISNGNNGGNGANGVSWLMKAYINVIWRNNHYHQRWLLFISMTYGVILMAQPQSV